MTQEQKHEITLAQLKEKHPKIKNALENEELSELVASSPILIQRLFHTPALIELIKETPENKALLEAPFLDEIPASDLHSQLNKLQEIKFVVESYFDSIMDCPMDEKTQQNLPALSAEQKLKALDALLSTHIAEEKELEKLGVMVPIQALRKILQHERPQNRHDFASGYGRMSPRNQAGKKQIYYALSGHEFQKLLKPEDIKKLQSAPPQESIGDTLKLLYIDKIWPQGITLKNGYNIKCNDIAMIKPAHIKIGDQSEAFHGWEDEGMFGLTAQQTPTYCMRKEPVIGYLKLVVQQYQEQVREELGIQGKLSLPAFSPLLKQNYTHYDQASLGDNYLFHFHLVQDPLFDSPQNISMLLCHQASLAPAGIQNVTRLIKDLTSIQSFGVEGWDNRKQAVIAQGQLMLSCLRELEKQHFTAEAKPAQKDFYIFSLSQRSKKDQLAFWAQPEREADLKALLVYLAPKRAEKRLQGLWEYSVLINAQQARKEQLMKKQFAEIIEPNERSAMIEHLLTLPLSQRWLACNNQSTASLEALGKSLTEEKSTSAVKELQADLSLVQSTPKLLKTSFTTLSIYQQKQFIWGLLQLDQPNRLRILAEQSRLTQVLQQINNPRECFENVDIPLIKSWVVENDLTVENYKRSLGPTESKKLEELQSSLLPLMKQARNGSQLAREIQAFDEAVACFKKNAITHPSIQIKMPGMLASNRPEQRSAFVSVLLHAGEETVRRVIKQIYVYYPHLFESLKRELIGSEPISQMYASSFPSIYPLAMDEIKSLDEVNRLHTQPYKSLTPKQQEQFLIGLLGIKDYKERLAIINRQRKCGLEHITTLTGKILKETLPYRIAVLSDLINDSMPNIEVSNRYQDIVAEINLVNKVFWPLAGEEAKAANTKSAYLSEDFNFEVFKPESMKQNAGTHQYIHSADYRKLMQLQIIIDLLGAGTIKRKDILNAAGTERPRKKDFSEQVDRVLNNLLKDASMRSYLGQFGSIAALQVTLNKLLSRSPSHSTRPVATYNPTLSVRHVQQDQQQVAQEAQQKDANIFRQRVFQDLNLLGSVNKLEPTQGRIMAGRIIRYFQTFPPEQDAQLLCLFQKAKEHKHLTTSPPSVRDKLKMLGTFIRSNDLHHLDAVDQIAVINQLDTFDPSLFEKESGLTARSPVMDSKHCPGLLINIEDISHHLWEDSELVGNNYLDWNDVFAKLAVGNSENETAAICSITGKRKHQEDRVVAHPLPLSCSLLSQDEIAKVLQKTYAQMQTRFGQSKMVGTTACTTVAKRFPANNGSNKDVISTVNAQLGDSYSFAVIKPKVGPLIIHPLSKVIHTLSNDAENIRVNAFLQKQLRKEGKISNGMLREFTAGGRLGAKRLLLKSEVKEAEGQEFGITSSRCFGQTDYEQDGLSHAPKIFLDEFTVATDAEVFIINPTDGIVESPQSLKKYGKKNLSPQDASDVLQQMLPDDKQEKLLSVASVARDVVKTAVANKSTDNMSVSVVKATTAPWVCAAFDGSGSPEMAENMAQNLVAYLNRNIEDAYKQRQQLSVSVTAPAAAPLTTPSSSLEILTVDDSKTLNAQVIKLNTDIEDLQKKNQALEKEVQNKIENVKLCEQEVKSLSNTVAESENQIVSLRTKLDREVKTLQNERLTHSTLMADNKRTISELQDKLQQSTQALLNARQIITNQETRINEAYSLLEIERSSATAANMESQNLRGNVEQLSSQVSSRKAQAVYYLGAAVLGYAIGRVCNSYLLKSELDFPLSDELPVVLSVMLVCLMACLVDHKFNVTGKLSQSCLFENSGVRAPATS